MNDVVFTEPELLALRRHAASQAWARHDDLGLAAVDWLRLSEKLAEAARQAGAVVAAHEAYTAYLNRQTLAAEHQERRYAAEG